MTTGSVSTGTFVSRLWLAALLVAPFVWPAAARSQSSAPPAVIESRLNLSQVIDKLVEKNIERADALEKYQGRRVYSLVYTGFPKSFEGQMVVDMTYDAPATKQFKIVSQTGSPWIIDRVLKKLLDAEQEALTQENRDRVALNTRNYDFSGFEHKNNADSCSYVVNVEPKTPSKLLYRGRVWVDSKDFAVCRIDAEPAKNPSLLIKKTEIHHTYVKIGDFWLPSENQSISTVRIGGRAVLTIKYQNYEILAARALKGSEASSSISSLALSGPQN